MSGDQLVRLCPYNCLFFWTQSPTNVKIGIAIGIFKLSFKSISKKISKTLMKNSGRKPDDQSIKNLQVFVETGKEKSKSLFA